MVVAQATLVAQATQVVLATALPMAVLDTLVAPMVVVLVEP